MWDEIVAKRGACDVASCLMMYIRQIANQGKISLVLYADNYVMQNKNRFIVSMMLHAVQITSISKPGLCFLEKGHTQNENDSVHATIEHSKQRMQYILHSNSMLMTGVSGRQRLLSK